MFEERNGSVGGEVLRRSNMLFDYQNQFLYLRKNRIFTDPFHYDMSGITLEHSGFIIDESHIPIPKKESARDDNEIILETGLQTRKTFKLKPSFQIVNIRKGSSAEEAGLQVGDVINLVNGRKAHSYKLEDLTALFASEDGKR